MKILIINCSLHPQSRSKLLAQEALAHLSDCGAQPEWIDLAQVELPFCDGIESHKNETARAIAQKIHLADALLLAAPIYNYDVNAAAKNLLELTGESWTDKIIGFACAAGGQGSYMSIMPFANSLMLDYRCVIIPRFVYATGSAFTNDTLSDPKVLSRVQSLAKDLIHYSRALKGLTENPADDPS